MTAFKMARSLTSERKRAARMLKGNMSVITDTGGLYCLPQSTRTLLMRLKSTGLTCIDFKKGNHESQLGHKALTVNNDMCEFFHETICIKSLGCWTLGKTSENTVICHESPYIQRQKHPIATAFPLLGPYWRSPERRLARWRASQTVAYLRGALIG